MGGRQNYSKPSFFKVMIGDFKKILKIPVDFIGNFNGTIPYDSILRSPSGCWNVNVREEEDGGLAFRKGWPDFVEAHYLGHDDFVAMKYIGNSQFSVKLYGRNGCEKVLPCIGSTGVKSIPSRNSKEYGETSKGKSTNNGSEFERHKYNACHIGIILLFKCDALKRKSTVIERRTWVDQADCWGKGKPYFLAIWTENKKYKIEIPEKVVRKIGRTLSDIVALKSANGILWNVELKRSEGKVWFYKGWKEFTEDHSFRDGHVLGISYNGSSQFYVHITNVMEHLDDSRNQGESNPKKRCLLSKMEEREEDDNTNEERAHLSFPPGLDIPMHLNKNRSPYLRNERTLSGEHTSNSPDASKLFHKSLRRAEGIERVAEVTKLFTDQTQFPFLAVFMRDTYLTYGYLHIPNSFAKKHLPKNIKNVMVRSSDDKVWTLGYCVRGCATKLSNGWTSLRRHLGLTEEDVCVFELLKERDLEMRVSVFREIDNVLIRV
ncbi:hypothetical protein MKX01_005993 [Papaver californicum]|nr:hypothetical protein MKX01_005993 [Papaver californicum]